jgi:hypothetical protein
VRLGLTMEACMTADARYRGEMEHAGQTMLAVLRGEMRAPRELRWSRRSGGEGHIRYPRLERIWERDRMADQLRTARDNCPRCGARGDAGCGHKRTERLVCL